MINKLLALSPKDNFDAEKINLLPEGDDFTQLTKLTVPNIISGAISLVMLVVVLIFFFMLILGGFRWVTSQGEEKAVAAARAQITNALIGLAIVFAAWAIMQLISVVFGIEIIKGFSIPTFLGST
jgi:TRAP-type C4-dicarboxylate transport system permease small subunit